LKCHFVQRAYEGGEEGRDVLLLLDTRRVTERLQEEREGGLEELAQSHHHCKEPRPVWSRLRRGLE